MSSDKQSTLKELIEILAAAEIVSSTAYTQIAALVRKAQAISEKTAKERVQLEAFLDQFTLESSLASTTAGRAIQIKML